MQKDKPKKSEVESALSQWERAATAVIFMTRDDLDMSQADLAARVGWSQSKLGKIEKRRTRLTFGAFQVLTTALGADHMEMYQRVLDYMRLFPAKKRPRR